MCGIVGFVRRSQHILKPADSRLDRALDLIRHRGPDASGTYADGTVWFGHVRLSILDLSEAGNQPMSAGDDLVITYNGEVYNFRDLAAELSLSGLRSGSDTEVILRAFEKLGLSSLKKLNGIFAFAIYDRRAQKVWLVRDRLGVKPLYFSIDEDGLCFGSEIKSIVELRGKGPECDLSSLHEWLYYGNALGGRTLYKGIRQLKPGHYLELDLRSFTHTVREYWSLQQHVNGGPPVEASSEEIIATTRSLLETAVRRQLVSDVPVGIFLSGGVDSSAITALASRYYEGKLATYSAGFDDMDGTDERLKARRVAEHFGTEHHELYIEGARIADLVEKMVHHHDMPFCDSANIPLYLMAAEISAKTKVVLQGDGGDEVFGGYRRYVTLRYRHLMRPVSFVARNCCFFIRNHSLRRRVERYVNAYGARDVALTIARLLTPVYPEDSPESVFTPSFSGMLKLHDPFARYRECHDFFAKHDIGNRMSLIDLMVELPDIFLEKVDRATMAASLEVRVPFLDNDLVEYVVRIPGPNKMPGGKKKWLLKQALHGIVPDDVLYGPKTGFNVPFGYWLRTNLKPLFFDHLAVFEREQPNILDVDRISTMFTAMEEGEHDRCYTLWNLLNLMVWRNNSKVGIVI